MACKGRGNPLQFFDSYPYHTLEPDLKLLVLGARRVDAAREREIDQRVYALYGLTADEVKIVEESTNK